MGTESEGELYVVANGGKPFKLSDVRLVKESVPPVPEIIFHAMNASFTCELEFTMKHRKGYIDFIRDECTPAARRYLRSLRRWKEKQRRRKLKEALK